MFFDIKCENIKDNKRQAVLYTFLDKRMNFWYNYTDYGIVYLFAIFECYIED